MTLTNLTSLVTKSVLLHWALILHDLSLMCSLLFFTVRWIENSCVAVKLLELWPNIVKMVNHWEKFPKPKRQSCKSYSIKAAAVNNDLTSAELHFFSFVAGIFWSFFGEIPKWQTNDSFIRQSYFESNEQSSAFGTEAWYCT